MALMLFLLLTRILQASSTTTANCLKSGFDRKDVNEEKCCLTEGDFPEYHADCSYRNLTAIPDYWHSNITRNITYLNLVGNLIKQLSDHSWNDFTSLRYLLLAQNEIYVLNNEDFKNLSRLELLDLSMNRIRYTCINEGVFKPLRNLQYLDLKQNLSDIWRNETYPVGLSQLPYLRFLMIDGIDRDYLPEMRNLSELYLSGEYGRCNITHLTPEYFSGVQNVRHLYVSNCSFQHIAKGTFRDMTLLFSLDLARNVQLGMASVPDITFGLNVNKAIKRLNLNSLYDYINYDMCSYIGEEDLKYIADTNIEMILIERNYIARVAESAIQYFPASLRYMSISDNMFMFGQYVQKMLSKHTLSNLTYFDTSKMFKSHIPVASSSSSSFEGIPFEFQNVDSYTNLYCSEKLHNRTNLCAMLTRSRVVDDFARMCHTMSINNISAARQSVCTTTNEQNQQRDVLLEESKLEYLDLSDNLPGTIGISFQLLNIIPNLKFLNVSNNYLGYPLLDADKNNAVFKSFHNLHTLDLSNNRITKLMPNIFVNLTQLKYLYLSNNRLECIPFKLSSLKKLTYIDLSYNHLEEVCYEARKSLDKLQNVNINLRCNNLRCTCKNIEFVRWLEKNFKKFNITNWRETNCSFENDTSIPIRELNFDQFYLKCSPPAYHSIILAVSLFLLAFIITVTCALVYRFKWNLRYLYYMTKFRLAGGYQPIDDREYDKDVFVSYANEDRIFVRDHIVTELETNGNLSLFVHDRDFCAGELVADNIMRAITSTRRTLVVLTEAYIRSRWCMYELNMARMEAADTGRNVLCVILKEDIPVKYLPIEIINIIKKKTYMEFPMEEEHMELFWNRLRATLSHDI